LKPSVVIPTKARAAYLEVALRSLAPQVAAHGGELVVVDDGPGAETREAAARCGAEYLANPRTPGLNGARNAGIEATTGELVVLVDDDIEVREGWLDALVAAAGRDPDVDVLTGPIRARFEDHDLRFCGREKPPITHVDLGDAELDVDFAWGANLAIRRTTFDRVGLFDETHRTGAGDEEEWERRLVAAGGRIRYIPGAALDHRRAGHDARVVSLARAARVRGRTARRFDVSEGRAPGLEAELRVLAGCVVHGPRFRCAMGPVMAAHSLGRVEEALRPTPAKTAEDFLSGRSGTVGGRRAKVRAALDRALDVGWRRGPAASERRRVLVLGIERPGMRMDEIVAELRRSRHDVEVRTSGVGDRGKFENLNALLGGQTPTDQAGGLTPTDHAGGQTPTDHTGGLTPGIAGFDWVLVVDDDIVLPSGFLDRFIAVAERVGLKLAQPAHRLASHAAWPVTRRRPGSVARETAFVEIGPVTAFHSDTFDVLLPFPSLRMGWGLDVHWAALARRHGWKAGVVDATPILHTVPTAETYPREAAIAEARDFLATRPYLPRDEADRTLRTHR
jgi:GT2 family glycosyltransferase